MKSRPKLLRLGNTLTARDGCRLLDLTDCGLFADCKLIMGLPLGKTSGRVHTETIISGARKC